MAKIYTVLSPVLRDGKRFDPGSTIGLTPEHAAPLIEAGAIKAVEGAALDKIMKRSPQDRLAVAVRAIGKLEVGNPDHWTKDGKPQVEALEAASGIKDISAAERDEAWTDYRAARA